MNLNRQRVVTVAAEHWVVLKGLMEAVARNMAVEEILENLE